MLRIAYEVRIFPLLDMMFNRSPCINPLIERLTSDGYSVKIRNISYETQRCRNEMIRVGSG